MPVAVANRHLELEVRRETVFLDPGSQSIRHESSLSVRVSPGQSSKLRSDEPDRCSEPETDFFFFFAFSG